jgi:AraC-like DNA-binding protein
MLGSILTGTNKCSRHVGISNRDKIVNFLQDNSPNFFSINQLSQELKISKSSVSSHCYDLLRFSPTFFEIKLFRLTPSRRKQACFRAN